MGGAVAEWSDALQMKDKLKQLEITGLPHGPGKNIWDCLKLVTTPRRITLASKV